MPSKWAMVDNSFPTFSGEEKPGEQIKMLVDYMFILVEELKYQLANLDGDNWNTKALENLQTDTTAGVEEKLAATVQALASLTGQVGQINSQVAANALSSEQAHKRLRQDLTSVENGLARVITGLEELQTAVSRTEDGTVIGREGETLRLVGSVYINGTLME